MSLLKELERKARSIEATVVFPEPEDGRIVEAAGRVAESGVCHPVLVGAPDDIPPSVPDGVEVRVVEDSELMVRYAEAYAEARGMKKRIAMRMVSRPLVYAGMMVACGDADGMVAGIAHPTATVLQAAGLTIGYLPGMDTASSCFIMIVPDLRGQEDVPLVFADCAVIVEPTVDQLAGVAVASARSARQFLGVTPRVAMLSFSTAGSAGHPMVDRVCEATKLVSERLEEGYVEGELQFDSAINPDVADKKGVGGGEVAGRANVMIFPDLNAANICYKAVRELCGARAVGPVLQGFTRPVNDLSRSANVEDVFQTTVITVLQSASEQ